jgi:rod shape-determining protein MreC
LEAQVTELQTQVIDLQQRLAEMEILSALLDFARTQPQNEYEAATVIAHDPSPFLQYVIINKGSDDGIRQGMPVVSDQGLVGRVVAITSNASRVQLITDSSTQVNVRIQPAETEAVLTGSITGDLVLDMIPQDAAIQPGDLVFTSGLGGNYPSDIMIGQVVSIRQQATALFQEAALQPVVDFARLEIVLVIVNFKPVDVTPLLPGQEETNQ